MPLKKWQESYSKKIGEPSGIPIKTPVDHSLVSEFIDHHEGSLNGVVNTAKPFEEKQSLNWFQKLIKLIFKIK